MPQDLEPGGADARALLVDPDPGSRVSPAIELLRRNGFRIVQTPSPHAAPGAPLRSYDLLLLETAADGYEMAQACRALQASGRPVLGWSWRDTDLDRIAALELGLEDFVSKAAHPLELLARARAALRRARPAPGPRRPEQMSWSLDLRTWELQASPGGERVVLTPQAGEILAAFCRRPKALLRREEIARIASRTGAPLAGRSGDAAVSRLRRALARCGAAGDLLRAVPNRGYVLEAEVSPWAKGLRLRSAAIVPTEPAPALRKA